MTFLKADKLTNINGVTVNEYLLTKHNPNKIEMPQYKITDLVGITVHNTERITVPSGTTPSEQYTRATVNGNMGLVRVHFYVDDVCAWQNLPLDLSGWHATDGGNGTGNRKTIAIECIMNGSGDAKDKKAEENCARLVAYLLIKYNLTTNDIYPHSHWYKKKYCPAFILPHWDKFKENVKSFMTPKTDTKFKPFVVRISVSNLNIRKGAGLNYAKVGFIPKGVYTIVETKTSGGYEWGKLKSGVGWIALKYTTRI